MSHDGGDASPMAEILREQMERPSLLPPRARPAHVARKARKPDEWDPPIAAYDDPYGPHNGPEEIVEA